MSEGRGAGIRERARPQYALVRSGGRADNRGYTGEQTYGSLHLMNGDRNASSRESAADRSLHSAGVVSPAAHHFAVGPARTLRAHRKAEPSSPRSLSGVRAHARCSMTRDSCSPQAPSAERAQSLRAGMVPAQDGARDSTPGANKPGRRQGSDRSATPRPGLADP